MTQKFALFPLQLVVFPGEQLNLHIFEARYRQLIADVEKSGKPFLVPTLTEEGMRPTATEVKLTQVVNRYPGGESDVRTEGGRVYFLEDFWNKIPGKLYPGGRASELPIDRNEDVGTNREIVRLTRMIYDKLGVDKRVRSVEEGFTTYDIGHYVGLTLDDEYKLLTLRRAGPRQEFLLNHLQRIDVHRSQGRNLRARAKLNGHFKELTPPRF